MQQWLLGNGTASESFKCYPHTAIDRSGAGAGGTRNISGTTKYVVDLETLLPTYTKRDPRLFSPAATQQTGRIINHHKTLADCSFFPMNWTRVNDPRHQRKQRQKFIYRHNDLDHLGSLLECTSQRTKTNCIWICLFNGRGYCANQTNLWSSRKGV